MKADGLTWTVSLCLTVLSAIFILISCPLLHISITLNWRIMELYTFLLLDYLLVLGERKNKLWVISWAAIQLMLGHVARYRWLLFWMRVSLRLPRAFSPIYIWPPPPHSLISTLLMFERKSQLSSFSPDFSIASVGLVLTSWLLKPFFFSEAPFTCKFFLTLTLHYFCFGWMIPWWGCQLRYLEWIRHL